jgi:hypothetical protein
MPLSARAKTLSTLSVMAMLTLAGATVWWMRTSSGPKRSQAAAAISAQPNTDVAALQDEVQRLRRDLTLVRANTAGAAPAGPTAAPPAPERRKRESPEELRARTQAALQTWYTNMDSQFTGEGSDPTWSAEATKSSEALVAKHGEHAKLVAADCARTMCRVTVSHDDPDAQRTFAAEMADEAALETEVAYKYDTAATPPTTIMWVARKGHGLPRPQRR